MKLFVINYIIPSYRMLPQMLQMVCQGLNDPSHLVRNAALFAVGQFSEHLQVDCFVYTFLLVNVP